LNDPSRWLGLALFSLSLVTLASRGEAQGARTLQLHVIDSLSGAPVGHAEVRVIQTVKDTAGWGTRLVTDSLGRAVLHAPKDEQLLMVVRRLGFEANSFFVPPADSDDVLFVALAPKVAMLPATITEAKATSSRLTAAGFYERQRTRPGAFLDSAAIADRKPLDILSVVRGYIKGCTVFYADGLPVVSLGDIDVRQVVGIEIYSRDLAGPPEFPNPFDTEHRCGTIVIWRRL